MTIPVQSATRQIARAAGTVMAAMVLSQLFGLVAKSLVAGVFGTAAESDAFFAANRFSEILFNLVAGGALASAFVPTFTGLLTHDDRAGAWRLASATANVVLLVLTTLAALAALFAPLVVRYILAPGWTDPEQERLAVELLRIQLLSPVIFGLSGLVMGILNAHQRFLFSALAPAMYQVGWIFGLSVLAPRLGVYGLAWGVVIGAALHLGLQVPSLLRLAGRRYLPTLGLDYPPLREVIRLMGPRLISVAVTQLNFLVNTALASLAFMPDGSLTGISLAFTLMIMPQAAIAQSIGIAALPTFSAQAARGRLDEMRHSLGAALRGVMLLALPASLGLIVLRVPLVQLIYQHGEFDARSTELVAWALLWYGGGLVAHSLLEVVTRAFFALKDTRTPTIVTSIAMGMNLAFSVAFSLLFNAVGWLPFGGLALANSLATFLEVGTLLVLLRRKAGGLGGRRVLGVLGQSGLSAAGMGLALAGWLAVTGEHPGWLVALGGVALGGIVYGLLLLALRVDEAGWVLRQVRRVTQR
jgi:putative peptidoglycan lipid II flippase